MSYKNECKPSYKTMVDMLPNYERENIIINDIYRVLGEGNDKLCSMVNDLFLQINVDTATWGLDVWEENLGIETDTTKTYEERRSNIKAKVRGTGRVGADLIKNVVDSYTNGGVDVEFGDSTVTILFNDIHGRPSNMDDVRHRLERIIPCHLALEYVYRYLLWNEFDGYDKTWDEWDALNLTWDELEVFREGDV